MFTHCVVVGHRVDDHKVFEVILVGRVVAVPCHHVVWRVVLQQGNHSAFDTKQNPHICFRQCHTKLVTEQVKSNKSYL